MIPAHMKERSMAMEACSFHFLGGTRRDAGGARRLVARQVGLVQFRTLQHQAKTIEGAGAKDRGVDENEGDKGGTDGRRIDGRNGFTRAQETVDGVRLAPRFRGDPAAKNGDEARRRHEEGETEQGSRYIEPAAPALPERQQAKASHK